MTIDDIKLQIAAQMEEVELLDFLGIDIEELIELLSDKIVEQQADFRETFRL